jgi:hypothetical protein
MGFSQMRKGFHINLSIILVRYSQVQGAWSGWLCFRSAGQERTSG